VPVTGFSFVGAPLACVHGAAAGIGGDEGCVLACVCRAEPLLKNTLLYRRQPGRAFPAIVLHDRWYAKAVRQLLCLYRAYRTGACQFGAMLANSVTPSCVDPTWMCSGMRLSPYPGKLLSRLLHDARLLKLMVLSSAALIPMGN
jgi:hypothetical protein